MAARLWLLLAIVPCAAKPRLPPCPEEAHANTKSHSGGAKATAKVNSDVPIDVRVFWVSQDGAEVDNGLLYSGKAMNLHTYAGHVFHFRAEGSRRLVYTYRVPPDRDSVETTVVPCEGMAEAAALDESRWAEFSSLVLGAGVCEGPSATWSCTRQVSEEELSRRNPREYGFHEDEAAGRSPFKVGTTEDTNYVSHQRFVVNITPYESGYLRMKMTDKMKSILYPWYEERLKDSLTKHEPVPGFYTNIHVIGMNRINLDRFLPVREGISREMQAVLEWWTKQKLVPTMTYGVRIYRRGSMLINHLDREDTHIASAVIQVGQAGLDEGWPLEVVHPHQPGLKEVYLQPGEMVLYEGARIKHGRPKRFKGEGFGNIFSHFKPLGYTRDRSTVNPYWEEGFEQKREL